MLRTSDSAWGPSKGAWIKLGSAAYKASSLTPLLSPLPIDLISNKNRNDNPTIYLI